MKKLKILILQHSEGTPPGTTLDWIATRGHQADIRLLHKGDHLPAPPAQSTAPDTAKNGDWSFDMVIVLGGPMNVDEVNRYDWLSGEKKFLTRLLEANIPLLGICLGGQLLAQCLGAEVRRNSHWEVGWHLIELDGTAASLHVFQWHQDTFGIPPGAQRFAHNSITANQGFTFGPNIVGVQFHPEANDQWVQECSEENPYPHGPFAQTPQEVRQGIRYRPAMTKWYFGLLDRMADLAQQDADPSTASN